MEEKELPTRISASISNSRLCWHLIHRLSQIREAWPSELHPWKTSSCGQVQRDPTSLLEKVVPPMYVHVGICDGGSMMETLCHLRLSPCTSFPLTSLEQGKMYEIMLWAQSFRKTWKRKFYHSQLWLIQMRLYNWYPQVPRYWTFLSTASWPCNVQLLNKQKRIHVLI